MPTRSPSRSSNASRSLRVDARDEEVLGHPVDRGHADARQARDERAERRVPHRRAAQEERPERRARAAGRRPRRRAVERQRDVRDAGLPRRARKGVRPAATRRQHDGRAGQQRRPDEVQAGAEHAIAGPELDERRGLLERRGEAARRVDDAPRRAGRARGEQDERRGVAGRAGGGRRHRRGGRGAADGRGRATRDVAQRAGASVARSGSRSAAPRRDRPQDARSGERRHAAVHHHRPNAGRAAWAASSAGATPGSSTTTTIPGPQRPEQPRDAVGVLAHAEGDRVAGLEPGPRERAGVRPHRSPSAPRVATTRPRASRIAACASGSAGAATRSRRSRRAPITRRPDDERP